MTNQRLNAHSIKDLPLIVQGKLEQTTDLYQKLKRRPLSYFTHTHAHIEMFVADLLCLS